MQNTISKNENINNFFIKIRFNRARNFSGATPKKISSFTKISKVIESCFLDEHFLIAVKMIAFADLTPSQKSILHEQLAEKMAVTSKAIDEAVFIKRGIK